MKESIRGQCIHTQRVAAASSAFVATFVFYLWMLHQRFFFGFTWHLEIFLWILILFACQTSNIQCVLGSFYILTRIWSVECGILTAATLPGLRLIVRWKWEPDFPRLCSPGTRGYPCHLPWTPTAKRTGHWYKHTRARTHAHTATTSPSPSLFSRRAPAAI